MANDNLNKFNKLCYKAQELIFNELEKPDEKNMGLFVIYDIEDGIENMTPIEQIFSIGTMIMEYNLSGITPYFIPQYPINIENHKYVADFITFGITLWRNGEEYPREYDLIKPLIIELDGYDYHKTKEQTTHDYERENVLKSNGYDIIRFTGSQVYNDVFKCIRTVYKYMIKNKKEVNEDA